MRDGKLLFIADAPRGLACGCVCASCRKALVAKKGSKRRHHFAHVEVTNCRGAAESALHLLAKDLLAELDLFLVPQYVFIKTRKTKSGALVQHEALVAKGGKVRINSVRVEQNESDFVPDIIIEFGSKSLIVEVAVTHKVARAKLRRIRRRNLPAIEIRLDPRDSFLSRESLKAKLQRDLASKVWLFHPAQREAERAFFSKLRTVLANDRTPERQTRWYVAPKDHTQRRVFAARSSLQPPLSEYDRTQDEFHRKYHRYPTMEECLRLWPQLWKP
jgi:hypothetical protein